MIIDTASDPIPHLAQLKAAGVETIFSYLSPFGNVNSKVCTPKRAHALADHNIRVGLISEGYGDFRHGAIGHFQGVRDAEHAKATLPLLGAPKDAAVYFAIDTDASEGEIRGRVLPYFNAIRPIAAGNFKVGVYGSGLTCRMVREIYLADFSWLALSRGWRESREYKDWNLRQYACEHIGGILADLNGTQGEIGDYIPWKD